MKKIFTIICITLTVITNAQNTFVRQSNYKSSLAVITSPQFTEVWAPLDGYFFNAGLKIKL